MRRLGRQVIVPFLLGAIGAAAAVLVAGRVSGPVGPFEATVTVRPALTGETLIRLAPLGSLHLDTHDAPFALVARVDELRADEAQRIVQDPESLSGIEDELAADARGLLRRLAIRSVVVALIGGALVALIRRTSLSSAALGAGAGVVVSALALTAVAATWRPTALAEPRYTGLLTIAPQAVGSAEEIAERFDEYRAQLARLVGNLSTLYEAGRTLPVFDSRDATIRVLHVSDIHLNPAAFDLMRQVVDQFDIDVIADTGDTTDWGTLAENQLIEAIGRIRVPYVWVRGNHDSGVTQEAVGALENVVVLDGEAQEVAGLRFFGIGDPRFTPDKSESEGVEEEASAAEDYAPVLARKLRRAEPPAVDVLLVHDLRVAEDAGNLVPLILAGHEHEPRRTTVDNALALVQGSTGGAGLRGLQDEFPEPLEMSVLYFDPVTDRLKAYDQITVEGLGRTGVRITRTIIDEEDSEEQGGVAPRDPTSVSAPVG